MTLTGSLRSATACIKAITVAPPDLSCFISSIEGDGFIEIPPVSKVIVLPTKTTGFSPRLPPLYSIIMKQGGC